MLDTFMNTCLRHCRIGSVLLLSTLLLPAQAQSQAVWQISDGDSRIYLAGTIHLLRQSDYPLPEAYEQAYADSDQLIFETDIGAMADMATQQQLMLELTYQDGRTLRSVLNDEAWDALSEYAASNSVPLAMMQSFKPGMVVTTLSVMEFQKLGFTPQGVDAYYHTRAMGDGKDRDQLETLDEQIALLAGMGEGYESDFVLYSLDDFENIADSIEEMIAAWRSGDLDDLETLFIDDMKEQSQELYDAMLAERNQAWLPKLETLFSVNGTEYVLVGAAHLAGDDGLLAMLEARGYEIERL